MFRPRAWLVLAASIAAATPAFGKAARAWRGVAPGASAAVLIAAQKTVTDEEAAELARRATGGRVLSVKRAARDGRTLYRVKVLTRGGVVRSVFVDPQTGEVVE
ncbi:MAG: PepSY domain-containing protein [Gammaproteobacteria bacterium]|nr:PepSY domain-containing protein [Gammaproteobacteria bacterium]NIR28563.1 PepSY domain-containing protein [Gammaproteobacteria bacterium]NIR97033.1 PepSY domain-containing protein [Gammaproteobacteria bacterium]NIT62731.1 PepSY domain-containing protein [Gammaproteobacteria bacterium]NIV19689.1 hypothetical protein [Gammaproteobacteria bacterium]